MKLFLLFLLSISSVFAAEVAVIETTKTGAEIQIIMTDDQLSQNLEKQFIAHACKSRMSMSTNLREFYFPLACRAHVTKFLLESGYKPDQITRTFIK